LIKNGSPLSYQVQIAGIRQKKNIELDFSLPRFCEQKPEFRNYTENNRSPLKPPLKRRTSNTPIRSAQGRTSKNPKPTQAPAIHGAPKATSELSTRAKRFGRGRGRREIGPYPVVHDGLEPDERGDAVVLGGGERRRAPLRRQHPRRRLLRHVQHDVRVRLPQRLHLRERRTSQTKRRTDGRRRRRSGSGSGISPGRQPFRKKKLGEEERERARWLLLVLWCCGARRLE
jgi:hypothetical protein